MIPRNPVWRFVWNALRVFQMNGQVMELESPSLLRSAHANKILPQISKLSISIQVKVCCLLEWKNVFLPIFDIISSLYLTGNSQCFYQTRWWHNNFASSFWDFGGCRSHVILSNHEGDESWPGFYLRSGQQKLAKPTWANIQVFFSRDLVQTILLSI